MTDGPYREPAPHVCVFDQERYVPPHSFVRHCVCGKHETFGVWFRRAVRHAVREDAATVVSLVVSLATKR